MAHIHSLVMRSWASLFATASRGVAFTETDRNLISDLRMAADNLDFYSRHFDGRMYSVWIDEFLDWNSVEAE